MIKIKIPPIIMIIVRFVVKNELNALVADPKIKNVVEIPNVKNIVFLINVPFFAEFSVTSFTLLFASILKYTGKIGKIHGEKMDKIPSIKTITTLIFSKLLPPKTPFTNHPMLRLSLDE